VLLYPAKHRFVVDVILNHVTFVRFETFNERVVKQSIAKLYYHKSGQTDLNGNLQLSVVVTNVKWPFRVIQGHIFWVSGNATGTAYPLIELQTRNILDCGQSDYSSRIIFSCLRPKLLCIHESGSDNSFQRYGHSKFSKMTGGPILDLVQPEVGPVDPSTSKTLPRTQTWSGSDDPLPRYGRSKFYKMRGRSVGRSVGRSSVLNVYIVLMYSSSLR